MSENTFRKIPAGPYTEAPIEILILRKIVEEGEHAGTGGPVTMEYTTARGILSDWVRLASVQLGHEREMQRLELELEVARAVPEIAAEPEPGLPERQDEAVQILRSKLWVSEACWRTLRRILGLPVNVPHGMPTDIVAEIRNRYERPEVGR